LGHVNEAIYYTFLGQFQRANQVLNYQWTTLYCALFVFALFDSYRVAVEINKMAWLESRQKIRNLTRNAVQGFDLSALDKRIPWVSAFWSIMFTGLGHIYCHKIVSGFLLLGWTVTIAFHAKLPYLVMFTLTGQIHRLHELAINYEWALFFSVHLLLRYIRSTASVYTMLISRRLPLIISLKKNSFITCSMARLKKQPDLIIRWITIGR
jgi:TM2 domain-containing membrane protein YozV